MLRTVPTVLLLSTITLGACSRGGGESADPAGGAGGPGGGMPPMPVEAVVLAAQPVEQTSEFVATLRSRRSTTIQPQVDGFLTRINVRSGQTVKQGAQLFVIDSGPQQAALAATEGT